MWRPALPLGPDSGLPLVAQLLGAPSLPRLPVLGAPLALGSAVGQLPQRPMRLSSALRRAAGGRLVATGRFTSSLVSPAASWLQGQGAQSRIYYQNWGGEGVWAVVLVVILA